MSSMPYGMKPIMNKGHIVAHVRKEGLQEQTLKELFFTSTQHEVGEAS